MLHNTYEALSVAIRQNSVELAKKVLQQPGALIQDENWTDYILLIKALQLGRKRIAKLLLKNGCRVNRDTKTNFFHTPLYYAVRLDDIKIVSILLDKGALINRRDFNKETALYLAMRKNSYEIVKIILSKYFCYKNYYSSCESQHYTAYYIACLTGKISAMNIFKAKGIFVENLESNLSWSKHKLLHFAVDNNLVELIEVLLMCGAKITTKNPEGMTSLHLAFKNYLESNTAKTYSYKERKILDMILSAHTEQSDNCVDINGISHFHIACTQNNTNVVKIFLESGVDVNSKISLDSKILSGYTPLHCAVHFRCTNVALLLLQYNADVNAVTGEGCTALYMVALATNKDMYMMGTSVIDRILLARDEKSVNSINKNGVSHFHIACTRYNLDVVKGFLERGVDVDITVSQNSEFLSGYTPLHCAVEFNSVNVVELLLHHQANINATDAQGLTALQLAFIKCDKYYTRVESDEIIDLILSSHTEQTVNSVDNNGLSHFHIACTRNDPNIVEYFLKSGADINSKISLDSKILPGYTPLHCAVEYNKANIVKLLLQYNADVNPIDKKLMKPLEVACSLCYNKIYDLVINDVYAFTENLNENQIFGECAFSDDWITNRRNQSDIIQLLLKYQNDMNFKDKFIKQLFESYENFFTFDQEIYFILRSRDVDTIDHIVKIIHNEFLIRRNQITKLFFNNVNINLIDDRRYSILHILASYKYIDDDIIETAEFLFNKGIFDVNAKTITGLTPLHIAVKNGAQRRSLVELFLKHNADVNSIDVENHWTPLHLACQYFSEDADQYRKIIRALVEKGADVNIRDKNGRIPLFNACTSGAAGVIEILKHGADINIEDNERKTILHHIFAVDKSSIYASGCFTFRVIKNHIQKLKTIGYTVSKKMASICTVLERDYYNSFDLNKTIDECCDELIKLKILKVDNYTSLYNIIFKDSNQMASCVKNNAFINILNSDNFEKEFPMYGYLLKLQCRKGLEREALLHPAKNIISFLINTEMPISCLENILKYFSNSQLKEFLKINSLI